MTTETRMGPADYGQRAAINEVNAARYTEGDVQTAVGHLTKLGQIRTRDRDFAHEVTEAAEREGYRVEFHKHGADYRLIDVTPAQTEGK